MEPNDLIAKHDQYLEIKGISLQTRDHYRSFLFRLLDYLELKPDQIALITTAQLRQYLLALKRQGRKDETLAKHVTMMKAFFGFALQEGFLKTNPADRIARPKIAQRLPRALSPDEVRRLFAFMANSTSEADKSYAMLFHLCYVCGLRIREAASVQRQQIDLDSGTLRVIGKGNKERLLFLRPKTVVLLKEHLARVGVRDYLFPGDENGHVPLDLLRVQFQMYVQAAGFDRPITAHALRHSIAVHYLLGGAPISFVQQLLGHASLATTGIYTRLTDAMTKDIALKTPTGMDSHEEKVESGVLKEERREYNEQGDWSTWVDVALGEDLSIRKPRLTRRTRTPV